jgi:hypothetical protein
MVFSWTIQGVFMVEKFKPTSAVIWGLKKEWVEAEATFSEASPA